MRSLVVFFLGVASLAAVAPATSLSTGAEPAVMLLLGTALLCAGFLRRGRRDPHRKE